MPDGSSSAAPVIKPGPRFSKKRRIGVAVVFGEVGGSSNRQVYGGCKMTGREDNRDSLNAASRNAVFFWNPIEINDWTALIPFGTLCRTIPRLKQDYDQVRLVLHRLVIAD